MGLLARSLGPGGHQLGLILRYWATREGLFSLVGKFAIWQALGRALGQLSLALLGAPASFLEKRLGAGGDWRHFGATG